jgi:hypothetical protein
MEQLVEKELSEETEILGEYQPQCHFAHKNPISPDVGSNLSQCGWKMENNHSSI